MANTSMNGAGVHVQGGGTGGNGRERRSGPERVGAVVLTRGESGRSDAPSALLRHPLLPVALIPQLAYPLRWLERAGIAEIAVSLREPVTELSAWLASQTGLAQGVRCVVDPYPRGPAGSVRDAAEPMAVDRLVVVEGARLPLLDLGDLLATHAASGAAITTVLEHDRRGRTPHMPAQPGGIYVFERAVLDLVSPAGFQDIKQGLLLAANEQGLPVQPYARAGITPAITDFGSYLAATRWLVSHASTAEGAWHEGYRADGEALLHPDATIDPTVELLGPVLVGPGAQIEAGAVVVGPSVIGAGATVQAGSTVACSVLLDGAVVSESAHVDHVVLAPGAVVEAGTLLEHQLVMPTSRSRWGTRARGLTSLFSTP